MMANKRSGTLWVTDDEEDDEPMPMHYALGIAVVITIVVIVCLNFMHLDRALQAVKKVTEVSLAKDEPPPVIEPPPEPPPEPPKKVEKIVKQMPQPVAPTATPISNVVDTPTPVAAVVTTPTAITAPTTPEPKVTAAIAQPVVQAVANSGPVEIGLACATQVKPVLPRRAIAENISGKVTARITIRGAKVIAVDIVSATPKGIFEGAVRNAMMQYQCAADGAEEVVAEQSFDFNLGG